MLKYDITENLKEEILENGIRLVHNYVPTESFVNCRFVFDNTGSLFENENEEGFLHFIEHLLLKPDHWKTKNSSQQKMYKLLEKTDGEYNGTVNKLKSSYYFIIVSEEFENCLKLLGTMLTTPDFSKQRIESEFSIVKEELDSFYSNHYNQALNIMNKPYDKYIKSFHPTIGSDNTINLKNLTTKKLLDLYNKFYIANNLTVYISGGFNSLKNIKQILNSLKFPKIKEKDNLLIQKRKEELNHIDINKIENNQPIIYMNDKRKQNNADMIMLFNSERFSDSMYTKEYIISFLLNQYIGDGINSLLFKKLRVENNLLYDIQSSFSTFKNYLKRNFIEFSCSIENIIPSIGLICKCLEDLYNKGIKSSDLQILKNKNILRFQYGINSNGIIYFIEDNDRFKDNLPKLMTISDYIDILNSITVKEFNKVLRKQLKNYLEDKKYIISIRSGKSQKEMEKIMKEQITE